METAGNRKVWTQRKAESLPETTKTDPAQAICWDRMDSPLGTLFIASSPKGLCRIQFGVGEKRFLHELEMQTDARPKRDSRTLTSVTRQLQEYFRKERTVFDLKVDLGNLTPFQKAVLGATGRIPRGEVLTYGQVARRIGNPRACRAVGQALGKNPVPIVIPCHRVVAGGGLGGFSGGGGLASKKILLRLEGAI